MRRPYCAAGTDTLRRRSGRRRAPRPSGRGHRARPGFERRHPVGDRDERARRRRGPVATPGQPVHAGEGAGLGPHAARGRPGRSVEAVLQRARKPATGSPVSTSPQLRVVGGRRPPGARRRGSRAEPVLARQPAAVVDHGAGERYAEPAETVRTAAAPPANEPSPPAFSADLVRDHLGRVVVADRAPTVLDDLAQRRAGHRGDLRPRRRSAPAAGAPTTVIPCFASAARNTGAASAPGRPRSRSRSAGWPSSTQSAEIGAPRPREVRRRPVRVRPGPENRLSSYAEPHPPWCRSPAAPRRSLRASVCDVGAARVGRSRRRACSARNGSPPPTSTIPCGPGTRRTVVANRVRRADRLERGHRGEQLHRRGGRDPPRRGRIEQPGRCRGPVTMHADVRAEASSREQRRSASATFAGAAAAGLRGADRRRARSARAGRGPGAAHLRRARRRSAGAIAPADAEVECQAERSHQRRPAVREPRQRATPARAGVRHVPPLAPFPLHPARRLVRELDHCARHWDRT